MTEQVARYFGAIDGQSESGTWVHYQDYLRLEKRLAEAEAKIPRWIPVSERLPARFVTVIGIGSDKSMSTCYLRTSGDFCGESFDFPAFEKDGTRITAEVTHWMPLPEPPKEAGDE